MKILKGICINNCIAVNGWQDCNLTHHYNHLSEQVFLFHVETDEQEANFACPYSQSGSDTVKQEW